MHKQHFPEPMICSLHIGARTVRLCDPKHGSLRPNIPNTQLFAPQSGDVRFGCSPTSKNHPPRWADFINLYSQSLLAKKSILWYYIW